MNLSDNPVHINKNTKLAHIRNCIDYKDLTPNKENCCLFVNSQDTIPNFDHADLTWESDINLEHLEPNLKIIIKNFLQKNKDVFAASVLDLPGCNTIPHVVNLTDDKPVKCKMYRVPFNLRQEMETQLDMLLQANIISPSMSEFASPVILVKKGDGSYRLAVDFRQLNKKLVKDAYPIPNITDSVDALTGSNYFSTLDLTSGFFQQEIRPEDRHKTAIITHKGLFQWNRNAFGMSSSGASFQRLMNFIFGDLSNSGILVYIDDIIVASKDIDSHLQKLNTVFMRLRQHNLKLKPSKCKFLSSKIQYLGFEVERGHLFPINKNIEVIKNFKVPNSRKTVRSFIGCISFYRKFIPDFSKRTKNLTNLTKETGKFIWTQETQNEFDDLKNALISKPCLSLPNFNKDFFLYTDASGEALGAVLTQLDDNNFPHPVAFASRKLKPPETKYSPTERELLALVWATSHFKCYLANKHFFIFTDHAPLTYMLKIRDPTSRMAKWICTLSDFNFTTKFIQGKVNCVADFLSRFVNDPSSINSGNNEVNFNIQMINSPTIFSPDNEIFKNIKELQKADPKCCNIAKKIANGDKIAPNYMNFHFLNDVLVCKDNRKSNILHNPLKLIVPKELVPQVFHLTHESSAACHQGFKKTIDRIRENFYWPGMSAHIKNLVDSCHNCQMRRAHNARHLAPLQRMTPPVAPMSTVHCDCLGPFPITMSGNRYIIAYIDSFSKWPEAYPVPSINSDRVAETLADFISRYGAPSRIITDRGSNFLSQAIEKVYKQLGIKHIATTPYHPSSNAQIERQNRTLINALSHVVNDNHTDWDIKLKFALLALRSAVHTTTHLTPAAVLYGRNLHLPYSFFEQPPAFTYNDAPSYCEVLIPSLQNVYAQVSKNLLKAAEAQEKYREKSAVNKDIKVGDLVWLYTPVIKPPQCRKFAKLNTGPFQVIKQINDVNYSIAKPDEITKVQTVHVDRLAKVTNRLNFQNENSLQNTVPTQTNEASSGTSNNSNNNSTINNSRRNPYGRRHKRRNYIIVNPQTRTQNIPDVNRGEIKTTQCSDEGRESNANIQPNYFDTNRLPPVRLVRQGEDWSVASNKSNSRYCLRNVPSRQKQ